MQHGDETRELTTRCMRSIPDLPHPARTSQGLSQAGNMEDHPFDMATTPSVAPRLYNAHVLGKTDVHDVPLPAKVHQGIDQLARSGKVDYLQKLRLQFIEGDTQLFRSIFWQFFCTW